MNDEKELAKIGRYKIIIKVKFTNFNFKFIEVLFFIFLGVIEIIN